jgi:hypothetical protein
MSITMALKTPEEFLKETDHLFKAGSEPNTNEAECEALQREYENLQNEYYNPNLPAKLKTQIAAQLRAIARSLQSLHCGIPVPQ